MTTSILRWDPTVETPFRALTNRIMASNAGYAARPAALDMRESRDEYVIEVALPGIKSKDLDITLEQGHLTIRAVRSEQTKAPEGFVHREIWPGEYSRSVFLSSQVDGDKAEASFADGILTLRIPKAEAAKPRRIKIKAE